MEYFWWKLQAEWFNDKFNGPLHSWRLWAHKEVDKSNFNSDDKVELHDRITNL